MADRQTGPAKLYIFKRKDTPFCVVYRDPTQREKDGRAKRIPKWFADEVAAKKYRDDTNERLLTDGAAGVGFDANLRADAVAARRHLDVNGHMDMSLVTLAQSYTARVTSGDAAALPIGPEIEAFLHDKVHVEGAARETVRNLENRLWFCVDLCSISTVGEITRLKIEPIRARKADPQTRRNDMSAFSSFCSWLLDKGKIDHHPLKGLKRPKVPHRRKPTHTPDEVLAMLQAAQRYRRGKWLGSVAALYFIGPRPSEMEETRIIYGRHPVARIEGGKLRGRANRTVALMPAAVAWLKKAGSPAQVKALTREVRRPLCKLAGVKWKADIPRHTYITCRLLLVESDATVAREAGTSEAVIHRTYRNPTVTKADARRFEALRPKRR
jgi:integrase